VFRELAVSYLGRSDLAHVDQSDFSQTAMGKSVEDGKTQVVSSGLTRGHKLSVVKPAAEPMGSATPPAPSKGATQVTAIATGTLASSSAALAANLNAEPTAFKRDLDPETAPSASPEETLEVVTEVEVTTETKTTSINKNEERVKSMMQGYTGNSCDDCGNFTMVRNGTCEKCDTCGATSGCS